ncbi:LOW QUALITY PROTEIN: hypothetical protein U9M48_027391, partial [Paspalum notatum var. saurae]
VTFLLARHKRRDALLVPEVVFGVNLTLRHRKPLVIVPEVLFSPNLACLVAADVAHNYVLPEVQVPVVEVRLPRVGGHVWLHEREEVPDPLDMRCAVLAGEPVAHVLDVVQDAGAVRERRRRLRHAGGGRAVGVQDHEPRVGLREPGEDAVPRVPGNGLPDVVGRHLGVGAQGAASHHWQERVARAQVEGLEGRGLVLEDRPYEQVVGEGGRDVLPPGHDVHGALVDGHRDREHRDRRRDGHEPHLPRQHDAEALAAAAADGPEHVGPHGVLVQEPSLGVHQHGVQDVVDGQAVLAQQRAEAAAAEMSPDADGRAQARRERELVARLRHGVVELAERRAGLHPRGGALLVDADGAEVGQVDHREHLGALGPVRQALSCPPLRTRRRTPCRRPQTTAACTWDVFVGVTIHCGLTVVGVKNIGFLMEDTRTDVNDGELCVNTSWLGMLDERHWRKPSDDEA